MGVMGGHRIVRGGEYQLIGLIALLRLVFDTAALRGKSGARLVYQVPPFQGAENGDGLPGPSARAITCQAFGPVGPESVRLWVSSFDPGKGGRKCGLTWEKAGRRRENGPAFPALKPP